MRALKCFKLSSYDVIAFDLDNTLCNYNLANLFTSHFNYLTKYLADVKNYNIDKQFSKREIDFISRGLFMDFERGNVLKLTKDGVIVRACHGTRNITENEIVNIYGADRRWWATDEYIKDKLKGYYTLSNVTRSFLDFTDVAATAVYGKAVDCVVDGHFDKVWPDLLEAIVDMYSNNSDWSLKFRNETDYFCHRTDKLVCDWLLKLKKYSRVGLITSANAATANSTATYCLGDNWKELFDFMVYKSGKPAFFTNYGKFKDISGNTAEFSAGEFTEGSFDVIEETIAAELERKPNSVYFGDSPIHDWVAPKIDTVAIVEELLAEEIFPGSHPHKEFISSTCWGSYLTEGAAPTVFGDIVANSKFCAPSLMYFASKPIDYTFKSLWPQK